MILLYFRIDFSEIIGICTVVDIFYIASPIAKIVYNEKNTHQKLIYFNI